MSDEFIPVITDLPYNIPADINKQIARLSKVMGIPSYLMRGRGKKGVQILCGVIIYRHLERLQKHQVMKLIHNTKEPRIIGKLTEKIVDTVVNPNWGLWSLTNKELETRRDFHRVIDTYMTFLGFGVSVSSVSSLVNSAWSNKKFLTKNFLLIIVWGGVWYSKQILVETQNEIDSRKEYIKTPYH